MPAIGLAHKLDVGAKRLVDGITDPTLSNGAFYASGANTLTGPLVNQADFLPDLANPSFQDHANEAIHRFITYHLDSLTELQQPGQVHRVLGVGLDPVTGRALQLRRRRDQTLNVTLTQEPGNPYPVGPASWAANRTRQRRHPPVNITRIRSQ